jgi:tetrahydromethanopterin S-methyltransferase subunit G
LNEAAMSSEANLQEAKTKLRELEIRVIGVDGNNGLTKKVHDLEKEMSDGYNKLMTRLDDLSETRDKRLRELELRVYLICGVPAIVAATAATLKFLHLIN